MNQEKPKLTESRIPGAPTYPAARLTLRLLDELFGGDGADEVGVRLWDGLDTAQEQKLDHICRKLRLQPGQRLLDVGCGWGGLVIHAAQQYGVDATGITLSQPQADLANERIATAGLTNRCRALVRDYREMDKPGGYDALVSVGMFEHVGAALLPTYFARAWQLLKPGGVFLNHGIANTTTDRPRRSPSFSDTYVFPDGELVPISTTLRVAEEAGFEVRDVESLREHYALTLRHWVRRLEAHHEQALQFVDEPTYRVWRPFMSGSAHGFSVGRLNVYQALLVRPGGRGRNARPTTTTLIGGTMLTQQAILDALRPVVDPEIGISVVDLGMIREIAIEGDKVEVKMVLTTPFCPLAGMIAEQVRQTAATVEGVKEAKVTLLDEPWNPAWMQR